MSELVLRGPAREPPTTCWLGQRPRFERSAAATKTELVLARGPTWNLPIPFPDSVFFAATSRGKWAPDRARGGARRRGHGPPSPNIRAHPIRPLFYVAPFDLPKHQTKPINFHDRRLSTVRARRPWRPRFTRGDSASCTRRAWQRQVAVSARPRSPQLRRERCEPLGPHSAATAKCAECTLPL